MKRALRFLSQHNEVAFATSDGNLPKIRIFQIMKQEGNVLYFSTSTEKAVWKELMQNPNVEVLAYADNISVRCSGMVKFDVEDDVKRWIYDHTPFCHVFIVVTTNSSISVCPLQRWIITTSRPRLPFSSTSI